MDPALILVIISNLNNVFAFDFFHQVKSDCFKSVRILMIDSHIYSTICTMMKHPSQTQQVYLCKLYLMLLGMNLKDDAAMHHCSHVAQFKKCKI